MNVGYVAICYICNERCRFCPYAGEGFAGGMIPFERLKEITTAMKAEQEIGIMTISGGEPTLHPYLWDFIEFLNQQNIDAVLLTNGERFCKRQYIEMVENTLTCKEKLSVITTLHSHLEREHEFANQTPGSFNRSLEGLLKLADIGIHVTVKHCVTKENYQDLEHFYDFVEQNFPENVDIQLCSVDYCGMTQEEARAEKLSFQMVKPYMELMLDSYISRMKVGNSRRVYCLNMPLCSSDPYYWQFYIPRGTDIYDGYIRPDKVYGGSVNTQVEENVYPASLICKKCAAFDLCPGTYKSAFEFFPEDLVAPYRQYNGEAE